MSDYIPPLYNRGKPIVRYDYSAFRVEEIIDPKDPYAFTFQKNEMLTVAHVSEDGWYEEPAEQLQKNNPDYRLAPTG